MRRGYLRMGYEGYHAWKSTSSQNQTMLPVLNRARRRRARKPSIKLKSPVCTLSATHPRLNYLLLATYGPVLCSFLSELNQLSYMELVLCYFQFH